MDEQTLLASLKSLARRYNIHLQGKDLRRVKEIYSKKSDFDFFLGNNCVVVMAHGPKK